MKTITSLILMIWTLSLFAQQKLDASFSFQTDPNKKYSLYIPSTYSPSSPNSAMLAFHPFNPPTWTSFTWRNELTDFAENNDLILICPDGGSDGRVDDQLDYDFTTALLDSVQKWYNINDEKIFAMGFSVGGKAMYEYGLNNASTFAGFIPIGPAINGTTEVSSVLSNAICKPFYLIHGENDAPTVRFDPIKEALEQNKAEVNSILMAGVGHTINFPNRASILRNAFNWVDTVKCKTSTGINGTNVTERIKLYPNLVSESSPPAKIHFSLNSSEIVSISIWNINGQLVHRKIDSFNTGSYSIPSQNLEKGTYFVQVLKGSQTYSSRLVVQ